MPGPTYDPSVLLPEVESATERLLSTAERLDDDAVRLPSLCAGWTRAHVLTHLARNAEGEERLLTWAETGVETPKYPSSEARNADIEAGAGRSSAELLDDLRATSKRLAEHAAALDDGAWSRLVRGGPGGTGGEHEANASLWNRLREVEVHHVDLDADYTPAHWSPEFVQRALDETMRSYANRDDIPPLVLEATDSAFSAQVGAAEGAVLVSGASNGLLAWLTGRSSGDGLSVEPPQPLPSLPDWR